MTIGQYGNWTPTNFFNKPKMVSNCDNITQVSVLLILISERSAERSCRFQCTSAERSARSQWSFRREERSSLEECSEECSSPEERSFTCGTFLDGRPKINFIITIGHVQLQ